MEWGAIWTYLKDTGTNNDIGEFIVNNAILLWLITKITPWKWDDNLFKSLKEKIAGKKDKSPNQV